MTDIDAIRQREQAAERGPWRVVEEHGRDIADEAYTRLTIQTANGESREVAEMVDPDHSWASKLTEENAAFIAHARTDVPALLDLLAIAQQDIRDRYEQIARLERHIAGLETQCNEQMHAPAGEQIAVVRALCDQYKDAPPPIFRGPDLSEHGKGYSAGTRDMARAVLGTLTEVTSPLPPMRPLPGPPTGPTTWPITVTLSACCGAMPGDVCDCEAFAAEAWAAFSSPILLPAHPPCLTDPALDGRVDVGDLTERMSPPARWQMTGDVVSVEARP